MPNISSHGTRLEALYQLAEDEGIAIDEHCPEKLVSMSFCFEGGKKLIGINREIAESLEECFAHELGHCMTDSFYIPYAPVFVRAKYELRADRWAVQHLIPFDALCHAVASGVREYWELGEYFSVTGKFVAKAIQIYAGMGMEVPEELYRDE